jgi:hypothetical protein
MIQTIKKGFLPTLIALTALSVSVSAAFYSISGLSKLFAGASFEVTIMASSLEVAKLVIASLLYRYWSTLNKILRTYLMVAVTVLVIITSMGIYGFLSAAYQETYSELAVVENQKQFIQQKIDFYQNDVTRYDTEMQNILNNINTLSSARSSQIQIKDTSSSTGFRTTVSTTEVRLAQKRIEVEEQNRKQVQTQRQVAADSLQKLQLQILKLDNNTEQAGELGPLKYLSGLTGISMDKIINILLLVIIFVFDPLAISLVIAANFAFEKAFPKKRENLYGELMDDFSEWDDLGDEDWPEPNDELKQAAERYKESLTDKQIDKMNETRDKILEKSQLYKAMDKVTDPETKAKYENLDIIEAKDPKDIEVVDPQIINPEDNTWDLNNNGVLDDTKIQNIKSQIELLKSRMTGSLSSWRRNKIQSEINQLQSLLPPEDDTTKIY